MSFIHDDPDFAQVLRSIAGETDIGPSLVEKDYWVTHCMWALHQTALTSPGVWVQDEPLSARRQVGSA